MGRYVEEAVDLWHGITGAGLCQLADGNLAMAAAYTLLYISEDNGLTRKEDSSTKNKGIWDNKRLFMI